MNTQTANGASSAASLRQQAGSWWRARTGRERQAVSVVVIVLALFAIWSLMVQPALRTVRDAPAQLDRLETQFQQMQRVAIESAALRGTARVSATQATQALSAATDRLGAGAKVTVLGDRATLTLANVSAEALRAWLVEVRAGARARPVEAQLQRSPQGFSGTLSVALGGAR